MGSDAGSPDDNEYPRTDIRRVAAAASRVRAAILFVVLDALAVLIGYGLAEVTYFRDRAPSGYWLHFTAFLAVAVGVTILSNRFYGLYGRMWRHAGADEARQLLLSVATTLTVLVAFWPVGKALHIQLVPPIVVVVGCMFSAAGMGIISMKLIGEGVFNHDDRQAAMRFAFHNAGVDCVTVGYKSPAEVDEAIDNLNAALA